jgi:hypothetical protein
LSTRRIAGSPFTKKTVASPTNSTYTGIFFSKKLNKILTNPRFSSTNKVAVSHRRVQKKSESREKSNRVFVYQDSSRLKNLGFGKIS